MMEDGENQPPPLPAATPPALPAPRPWNGWMTVVWLIAVMALWMTVQTVFLFMFIAFEGGYGDIKNLEKTVEATALDGDFLGLATVLTALVVCPFCLFLGKVRHGFTGRQYLALGKPKILAVVLWVVVTIGAGFLFNFAAPAMGVEETPEFMLDIVRSVDVALFLVLGIVVGAPLVEEFVFRGLLFRGWRGTRTGPAGAGRVWLTIIVTSVLWTALHVAQYDFAILGYIFLLGILLGYAREKTGNLWVPIGMHAANNAVATVETFRLVG